MSGRVVRVEDHPGRKPASKQRFRRGLRLVPQDDHDVFDSSLVKSPDDADEEGVGIGAGERKSGLRPAHPRRQARGENYPGDHRADLSLDRA